ncbi:MAG: aldo/keto reductase [Candidatus Aenigmarchaeota archaeon]|nr:aldo/keto reductase [Candidatus Aenigmarchaeota archaeon]
MDISTRLQLNNGTKIPVLGLGTWKIDDGDAEKVVLDALGIGYRHIDTAKIYGNEKGIGKAIKKSGVPRKELFITTKLWNDDHDDIIGACEESLKKLQLDYVDLYLMHSPTPVRNESWKTMQQLVKNGKAKTVGVSNFTIRHLNELLSKSKFVPAVNQVEFSTYLYQKELLEFCKSKGIQIEAYSPLTRGRKLNDSKLIMIADKYNKSPAQVLIRWVIQHAMVVIPKSKSRERLEENMDVFDFNISQEDMKKLDGFNENLRVTWDPEGIE